MTLPQMSRLAEEANAYAERESREPPAFGRQPPTQDLTKMTADQAANELRKYGFG